MEAIFSFQNLMVRGILWILRVGILRGGSGGGLVVILLPQLSREYHHPVVFCALQLESLLDLYPSVTNRISHTLLVCPVQK